MNNAENVGALILEIFTEKQKYDNKYNEILFMFIKKAHELVDLSEDLYQVENTIKLNKISLKDYILNSDLCNALQDNNINDYSINELKNYMREYELQNISDISSYKLALELYENLEELETLEDKKTKYEIFTLSNIFSDITKVGLASEKSYQTLYNKIVLEAKEKYLENRIIDDTIYSYLIQILNDIFNYYLYGYKVIPIER